MRNRVHFSLRLLQARAGPQARDNRVVVLASDGTLLIGHRDWRPELYGISGIGGDRELRLRGNDSNYLVRSAVECNLLPNDIAIRSELVPPKALT